MLSLKEWADWLGWKPETRGPFKVVGREQVYCNFWVKLTKDQVIHPDGRPGNFSVVSLTPGVGVLPLDAEGNVYLNREFKYAVNKISIEAPSGGIDSGESSLAAAKRELKEELGIEAKIWDYLGRIDPHTTSVDSPAYLFLARGLSFKQSNRDSTEFIEPLKVKLSDAVEMIMNGAITYAQSVALILKAKEYLTKLN